MHRLKELIARRLPLLMEPGGFRWLWLATLVSSLGDWLGMVALNLFVFNLTGSATALAGLLAVQAVPALLLGPLAGVMVDRLSRRHVMIGANLVAALAYGLLPLTDALWQVYALALLARTATSFFQPAERALIPDLVGRERLLQGNAAISMVIHLTMIAGPAIAGALVALSGASIAFVANAISFVLAALLIARISGEVPRTEQAAEGVAGWWQDLAVGLRYALRHESIRVLLLTTFVSSIAGAALTTIEVVYVVDYLGGGEEAYGILLSAAGIGAILASTTVSRLTNRFGLPLLYVASIIITGLSFFPYANIQILWFVILLVGFQGVTWIMGLIGVDTMLQHWVPDEMRGRVFSLIATERSAGHLIVAAVFAPLIDLWGPVVMLNISGVIYTAAGLYALSRLSLLRRKERVTA